MARHGLGVTRQYFSVCEVFFLGTDNCKTLVYEPHLPKPRLFPATILAELIEKRIAELKSTNNLKVEFQTPLRIRRNRELLEKITFAEFFKQCSLRLKFLMEIYSTPLEYDYQSLMKSANDVVITQDKLWRHNFSRLSNRQEAKLSLDGLLGEIDFRYSDFSDFLPFITACEVLHIGHASNLGLGKFLVVC